nr:hypothetical protein Iba_chr06dCG4360 [Ipomoea batatas]
MLGTRSGSTAIASGSIPNSVSLDACHGSGNKAEGFTKADSIPFPSISNSNLACMSKGREWKSASNTAMTLFNETETEENFVRASQFNCKRTAGGRTRIIFNMEQSLLVSCQTEAEQQLVEEKAGAAIADPTLIWVLISLGRSKGSKETPLAISTALSETFCTPDTEPGVTSQTTTVDGFTIGTPATCMAPESVMIASAAMMPLGPAPKSPLLVQNHFDGSPL